MKAILEFNLDSEEDVLRHKQMLKALPALLSLLDMDNALRDASKYHEDKGAENWREALRECMRDNGVDLEELLP